MKNSGETAALGRPKKSDFEETTTDPAAIRTGKVAILGRPNVGKSTLLNVLLGEPIAITSRQPQTTRDRILGVLTDADAQFVFLDTPGVHRAKTMLGARMNQEARDAARDADVVVFMTDVGPTSKPGMRAVDKTILREMNLKVPVILVINKVDRIPDKTILFPLLQTHAEAYPFRAIVPISAIRANGTQNLLDEVRAVLPLGPKLFEDDTLTDKSARFLIAEFVREQILRKTFEEVPHGVAVVVERFDESGRVPRIELAVHAARDSHKKILIGKGGELLKAIGTDARARAEALLGRQVHLQIWVRVTPGWYETQNGLREMGYGGGGEQTQ